MSDFYSTLSKLESAIGAWNQNYAHTGVKISLNDLLQSSGNLWFTKLENIGGSNLLVREKGLDIASEIAELVEQLQEQYEENKEEIDEIDPELGDIVAELGDGVESFLQIMSEYSTPIVLDLDGDGIELIAMHESYAAFDFGDGASGKHGWVGPDDGLLVYDKNRNGNVDDASELFGSRELDGFTILADIMQDGADTLINVANEGSIRLYNVSATLLTEENFIL